MPQLAPRPSIATPVDLAGSQPSSLNAWFRAPSPAYSPLSSVSFGPLENTNATPVPQMPDPVGIRGNVVETFNKLASYGPVQKIITGVQGLTRF